MENDASKAAAEFLWDKALAFTQPQFTPHPDDELGNDLLIDDGDWSMDWPIEWAEKNGFNHSNLLEWPHEWRPTLRNYGRWLSLEIT